MEAEIDFEVVISQLTVRIAELERQNALLQGVIAAARKKAEDE